VCGCISGCAIYLQGGQTARERGCGKESLSRRIFMSEKEGGVGTLLGTSGVPSGSMTMVMVCTVHGTTVKIVWDSYATFPLSSYIHNALFWTSFFMLRQKICL